MKQIQLWDYVRAEIHEPEQAKPEPTHVCPILEMLEAKKILDRARFNLSRREVFPGITKYPPYILE